MFCSDYPRGVVNRLWFWWFPAFDAFPVSPALAVPSLLALRRRPVSPLGFPARPFPRRFPAMFAAIPLPCLPRMKPLLAPLQQTRAHPWPASQSLRHERIFLRI